MSAERVERIAHPDSPASECDLLRKNSLSQDRRATCTLQCFGEQRIWADRSGRLRDAAGYVNTSYMVMPAALGARGRTVARDRKGHLALIALPNGRAYVPSARRAALNCG